MYQLHFIENRFKWKQEKNVHQDLVTNSINMLIIPGPISKKLYFEEFLHVIYSGRTPTKQTEIVEKAKSI